ncbi:hypothetical protein ScPMuIL_010394 [Solemya velum]
MNSSTTIENASDCSSVGESLTSVTESESEQVDKPGKKAGVESEKVISASSVPKENRFKRSGQSRDNATNQTKACDKALDIKPIRQQPLRFDTPTWYRNPCFSRYWKHYNQVMQWCQKHYQAVQFLERSQARMFSAMTTQYCDPKYWNAYFNWLRNSSGPSHTKKTASSSSRKSKKKRKRAKKKALNERKSRDQESVEDMSYEEGEHNGEQFEMEITEEMKEFFAHSERHRQERDARKEGSDYENQETHINIEDLHSSRKLPTSEAPRERPGLRRDMEMKMLYGKGSPMIQGMETALQMTYDRGADIKQPKHWPNIPLKITFS